MQKRLTGQPRATIEEREALRQKKCRIRDKFEINNLGNYERIYPLMPDLLEKSEEARLQQDNYDKLIYYSKEIWGESAAGGFAKRKLPIDVEKPVSSPLSKEYGL